MELFPPLQLLVPAQLQDANKQSTNHYALQSILPADLNTNCNNCSRQERYYLKYNAV